MKKHLGRRICSLALCASMVVGNVASTVVAADKKASDGYDFSLTREALYNALQDAMANGDQVDKDLPFEGEASEDYEAILEANGSLYELKPEIEENDENMKLRIFARADGDYEIGDDYSEYQVDGSEDFIFLLVNSSNETRKAVISVDNKVSDTIYVVPADQVVMDGEGYLSAGDIANGQLHKDETTEESAESAEETGEAQESTAEDAESADAEETTVAESAEEAAAPEESEAEDSSVEIVDDEAIEISTISRRETHRLSTVASPSEAEPTEPEVNEPETEAQTAPETTVPEATDPVVTETTTTATPSVVTPVATPSDASPSEAKKEKLDGDVYESVRLGKNSAAVAFVTTAGELELDDIELINPDSRFLTHYLADVEGADITVDVTTRKGTFPEEAELIATALEEDSEAYQKAEAALEAQGQEYTGMMALDIGFWVGDNEVEPQRENAVKVAINMKNSILPEEIDAESVSVQHLVEDENSNVVRVDTVADATVETSGTVEATEEAAVAEFRVDSFSTFTITWGGNSSVTVYYRENSYDGGGLSLDGAPGDGDKISLTRDFDIQKYALLFAKGSGNSWYGLQKVDIRNGNGRSVTLVDPYSVDKSIRVSDGKLQYQTVKTDGKNTYTEWESIQSGYGIYFIYKEQEQLGNAFRGLDTADTINITLWDYEKDDVTEDAFPFGGEGWTGTGGGVKQNLVEPILNSTGIPELQNGHSLAHLFGNRGTSANHLFQEDKEGYYYYNSKENFAELHGGNFELYAVPRGDENSPASLAQFLPFNTLNPAIIERTSGTTTYNYHRLNEGDENYFFGMKIDCQFIQPKNGQITVTDSSGNQSQKDMVFEFEGDDDVWVFIDDVLVLDMGGVHDNYSGSINFQNGKVCVSNVNTGADNQSEAQERTIEEMFTAAGKTWNGADYSSHSLKFFYLERGAGGSNCKLKFNIQTIPQGTINFGKHITYSNVSDSADFDFLFKAYVNVDGTGSKAENKDDYELYTGTYDVYNIDDLDGTPIKTNLTATDGVIRLKDKEMARLTDGSIKANSRFYVQEIGATSDKYTVSIDGTKIDAVFDENDPKTEIGRESNDYAAGTIVTFNNAVSDTNKYNLRVEKKIEGSADSQNADFKMNVYLGEDESTQKLYDGKYQVYNAADGAKVGAEQEATNGAILLKAGQYAEIVGLVGGNTVRVVETDLDKETYNDPQYEMSGSNEDIVTVDTKVTPGISGKVVEGKALGQSPVVTVTVTNKPKSRTLIVKKIVDGNMGDKTKKFDFTYTINGTSSEEYQFELSHEGQQQLTVPAGSTIAITEEFDTADRDGYTVRSYLDGSSQNDQGIMYTITLDDKAEGIPVIVFENKKQIDPPTGLLTNNTPYILMSAIAAFGVAGFTIASRNKLRLRRRDDE